MLEIWTNKDEYFTGEASINYHPSIILRNSLIYKKNFQINLK